MKEVRADDRRDRVQAFECKKKPHLSLAVVPQLQRAAKWTQTQPFTASTVLIISFELMKVYRAPLLPPAGGNQVKVQQMNNTAIK